MTRLAAVSRPDAGKRSLRIHQCSFILIRMDVTVFAALAEPNRLRIVDLLREGPSHVGELVVRLQLKQPLVSSHLKVLSRVGLVRVQPVAQRRIYTLRPEPFDQLATWASAYQELWENRLDRLEQQLAPAVGRSQHDPSINN